MTTQCGTEATKTTSNPAVNRLRKQFGELGKQEGLLKAMNDLHLCLTRKSSPESAQLYAELLSDLDTDLLIDGLGKAFLTSKSWLTPAELREMCLGGSQEDLLTDAAM